MREFKWHRCLLRVGKCLWLRPSTLQASHCVCPALKDFYYTQQLRNWMRAFSRVLCTILLDYLLGYDFNTNSLGCRCMSDFWCDLSSFTQPKEDVLKNVGIQVFLSSTDFHSMDIKYYWSWWDKMLVTKWFWVPLISIVWETNTMEVNGNPKFFFEECWKPNGFCSHWLP